jgi:prepilin-type N-terminal cleavage/methylation domain-containing protein
MRNPSPSRRGLTLVEMLVVLMILVLIAGTALTSTEGLVDQGRYESTRTMLTSVEDAMIGPPNRIDVENRPWISGFVADIGRLPKVVSTEPERRFVELWLKPQLVPEFSIQTPTGDLDVRVPGGWRGPYLRLGPGVSTLRDGYGELARALRADGTEAAEDESIEIIESLGSDVATGGTGYDEDLAIAIHRTTAPIVGPRHMGSVPVRVFPSDDPGAGANVIVRVYGPVEGKVETIAQHTFLASGGVGTHTFADLAIGARVLRAYQVDDPIPAEEDPIASAHHTAPIHVTVVHGGVSEITLTLPSNP